MIEQILIFSLGLLTAAIIWLLCLSAFWRRAVRITRARIEQSLPLTPNEIAAERDRLRAEQAVHITRIEQSSARMQASLLAAKAETGERLKAESLYLARISEGEKRIAALDSERNALLDKAAMLEVQLDTTTHARDLAQTSITWLETQRDTLTGKLNSAMDVAEQRRIALDEAQVQAERAREALASEAERGAQLRAELQTRQIELRELERRAASLENDVALARIRRGEAAASEAGHDPAQKAG